MGDPRSLLPHEVEIFVVRELRKAGLEPTGVKIRERTEPARGSGDYIVELGCTLPIGDKAEFFIIECRNASAAIPAAIVEALHAKLSAAKARYAMMFSTAGFEPNAIHMARTLGIPLLAVADGKTAFARSPWGMAGDPPAWVPEYMAEIVTMGPVGEPRQELLTAGATKTILERLSPSASAHAPDDVPHIVRNE
ncbi:MAG: restriction endonuclease [Gemmatimonadaceae bacterium]